jgi:hypothetical protein
MIAPRVVAGVAVGVALTALLSALDVVPPLVWAVGGAAALGLAVVATRVRQGSDDVRSLEAERAVGWRDFHRELIRARRRAHPLALVRLPSAAPEPRSLLDVLARVRGSLRRADAAWVDGSDVYVLLPETSREAAGPALARLTELGFVAERTPRLAVFPEDGLTSGALIAALAGGAPTTVALRSPLATEVVRATPIAGADDAHEDMAGVLAQEA